jgi:hypothetical protein
MGFIHVGSAARSGDLTAGAEIHLGSGAGCGNAAAVGDGTITLGSGATATGNLTGTVGGITLGSGATVNGQLKASGAITVGPGASSCGICSGRDITTGPGVVSTGPTRPIAPAVTNAVCPSGDFATSCDDDQQAECPHTRGSFICGDSNDVAGFLQAFRKFERLLSGSNP